MILSLYIDAFKYDVSCFACNKYYQIPDDPPEQPDKERSTEVASKSTQAEEISESPRTKDKIPKKLTLLR